MNTEWYYDDGKKVPFWTYRCPASARKAEEHARTHLCKLHVDHDGDHLCVCGEKWEPVSS